MQSLGRRYVRTVNHLYRRTGTLWEGRFRACAVHAEDYLFACMRYIELNPVRAGIVSSPEDYRHSSFRCNGLGEENLLVTEHALYGALGRTPEKRQTAYQTLFRAQFDEDLIGKIRGATAAGHLLAGERFRMEAEAALARPLGPARRGRPRKKPGGLDGEQVEFGF
jgi:putative transposase